MKKATKNAASKIITVLKKRLFLDRYCMYEHRYRLLREDYNLNWGQLILFATLKSMAEKNNPIQFGDDYFCWLFGITNRKFSDWMNGLKATKLVDWEFKEDPKNRKKIRLIYVDLDSTYEYLKRRDIEFNLGDDYPDERKWYEDYTGEISKRRDKFPLENVDDE